MCRTHRPSNTKTHLFRRFITPLLKTINFIFRVSNLYFRFNKHLLRRLNLYISQIIYLNFQFT